MTLGYLARLAIQALSAHALASSAAALVVALIWRRASVSRSPSVVARRIFVLRLLPSVTGGLAALLVGVAYGLWENGSDAEHAGPVALAVAAAGILVSAAGLWRAVDVTFRTWIVRRTLDRASEPLRPALPLRAYVVESSFPVVALIGLVMSRLFVARQVIEACDSDEFEAVIAHEQAHATTRDNMRRLAMTSAPDLLGLLPIGGRMLDAWLRAAELAADEWAARRTKGVLLASALVKVARLATRPSAAIPASALYRGEPITERVHRLLEPASDAPSRPWPRWVGAAACVAVLAAALAALPALHFAAEGILKLRF